jgi:hypothetical protein
MLKKILQLPVPFVTQASNRGDPPQQLPSTGL